MSETPEVYDENPVAQPAAPEGAEALPTETAEEPAVEPVQAQASGAVLVERFEASRPGKARLWAEGVFVFVFGLVMAVVALPALQDTKQSVYTELMAQAFGPDRHGLGRMLKGGFIPTWTRYSFGGEPYAANSQHEVFYPLSWPFIFLKTSTALDLTVGLHIALAFLGMWAYLRIALRSSMFAAIFAGLSFGISSQILDHVTLGDQLDVLVWTPFVFLGIHLALERGKLRNVTVAGIFIGLQFLAGHPEEWLYSLGAAVLYGVIYAIGAGPFRETPKRLLFSGIRIAGSVGMFVLLFGWQLFPTLLLKGQGFRNDGFTEQHPIPFLGGVNVLIPDYGSVLMGENVGFASIVALGLFGLFFGGGERRWLKVYLAVSAALGFTMALGNQARYPQFYNFFYHHISLIHQFRVPSRWLLLTCFAICVGGGLGVDVLLARTSVRVRLTRGSFAVVALLVFFGFAFLQAKTNNDGASTHKWALAAIAGVLVWAVAQVPWVPRIALAAALTVVAGFEAVKARPHAEYNQKAPNILYDDYGTLSPIIAADGGRALSIAGRPLDQEQASEFTFPALIDTQQKRNYYFAAEPTHLDVTPNNNIAVGSDAVNGRDNGLLPLARYKDFFDAATGIKGDLGSSFESTPPSAYNWQALNLLGLDYFIAPKIVTAAGKAQILADNAKSNAVLVDEGKPPVAPKLGLSAADVTALEANGFTPAQSQAYVQLWHRPDVSLVHIMHAVTDPVPARAARIALLSQKDFPLLTKAIVETPVSVAPAAGTDSVGTTTLGQTRVETHVTLGSPGLVVLADPYYPGWSVTVDGHKEASLAVDSAFRGVVVPAGAHTVVWTYHDRRLQFGLALAGATIVVLALFGVFFGRRRRKRSAVIIIPDPATAA